ncbi:MAG: 2Fe-2S iron-sulfur cluster-binding protein [Pyrinomonadaceae bacterium]|nr:2Fe-2S iron-sulfur cluster binding domain-containing protein [Blastocatellia bacterium]MDQ3491317.1 2Fe-2S iron-sulfur cluster-binding protein [Acidobacteriota bacterium]
MSSTTETFEQYLHNFIESDWLSAIHTLLPEIHEVDRNAVQIWFRFYPLSLFRYLQSAEDLEKAVQGFAMLGRYELKDQIDTSHHFLYGHRYWKTVKAAIEAEAVVFENDDIDLAEEIRQLAAMSAEKLKIDVSLVIAIAAVGMMTLNQTGLENFKNAADGIQKPTGLMAKSPDKIVSERSKDDSQGVFGFLKTVNKKYSIIYDEKRNDGRFAITSDQEIAGASALDRSQNWQEKDSRCWEGVIPVECLSASCGTCWIGVIAGQEKLSEVSRRERKQMKVFGYNQPEGERPFMRLSCQAKASGNATIVIPPWNGVFGKKIYQNVQDVELEPATTSARELRKVVSEAAINKAE